MAPSTPPTTPPPTVNPQLIRHDAPKSLYVEFDPWMTIDSVNTSALCESVTRALNLTDPCSIQLRSYYTRLVAVDMYLGASLVDPLPPAANLTELFGRDCGMNMDNSVVFTTIKRDSSVVLPVIFILLIMIYNLGFIGVIAFVAGRRKITKTGPSKQ